MEVERADPLYSLADDDSICAYYKYMFNKYYLPLVDLSRIVDRQLRSQIHESIAVHRQILLLVISKPGRIVPKIDRILPQTWALEAVTSLLEQFIILKYFEIKFANLHRTLQTNGVCDLGDIVASMLRLLGQQWSSSNFFDLVLDRLHYLLYYVSTQVGIKVGSLAPVQNFATEAKEKCDFLKLPEKKDLQEYILSGLVLTPALLNVAKKRYDSIDKRMHEWGKNQKLDSMDEKELLKIENTMFSNLDMTLNNMGPQPLRGYPLEKSNRSCIIKECNKIHGKMPSLIYNMDLLNLVPDIAKSFSDEEMWFKFKAVQQSQVQKRNYYLHDAASLVKFPLHERWQLIGMDCININASLKQIIKSINKHLRSQECPSKQLITNQAGKDSQKRSVVEETKVEQPVEENHIEQEVNLDDADVEGKSETINDRKVEVRQVEEESEGKDKDKRQEATQHQEETVELPELASPATNNDEISQPNPPINKELCIPIGTKNATEDQSTLHEHHAEDDDDLDNSSNEWINCHKSKIKTPEQIRQKYERRNMGNSSENDTDVQKSKVESRIWLIPNARHYYDVWREIFPKPGSTKRRGGFAFYKFIEAITAPPFNCYVKDDIDGVKFNFARINEEGGEEKFNCHAPHERKGWVTWNQISFYRANLRRALGIDGSNIFLVGEDD